MSNTSIPTRIAEFTPSGWASVYWQNGRPGWKLSRVGPNGSVLDKNDAALGPVYIFQQTDAAFEDIQIAEAAFAVRGTLFSGSPSIAVSGPSPVPPEIQQFAHDYLAFVESQLESDR